MKKLLLTTALFLMMSSLVQILGQVSEEAKEMSMGTRNALVIEITGVDDKLAETVWKDYTRDFYNSKTKWDRKKNEWVTADADIVALGMGNAVSLYATIEEKKENVIFSLWVDLGNSFVTSVDMPERYEEAEKLVMRYALELAQAKVKNEINDEEKNLVKMEDELKKLVGAQERYEREIEKAKEAIKKAEENIVENNKQQVDQARKIKEQKKLIEQIRKKLNDL
jgi:predicted RNase H-like nuclease (RuvC/YqgF family)